MWLIADFPRRAKALLHPNVAPSRQQAFQTIVPCMAKRVCYIHIGPHKTGTSSIQWFLKENRLELLKYGYLVPESGPNYGAHHALARKLCGQDLPAHQQSAAANFARALDETPSEAVIISSEALGGLLRNPDYARTFFTRIRELNLEPKLVLFPRNPSQRINSSYSSVVRTFRRSESFEAFVQGVTHSFVLRYSPLIKLADAHDAELIARPFTRKTIADGIVPEFLQAIGLERSQFREANVRRNEAAGPFTISVARGGGLTTTRARQIEEELQADNDVFAQRVWGKPWAEIFAADIRQEFTPNDFEMCPPDEATERRLERAVREMTAIAEEVLLDRALADEATWNDLLGRAGWTPRAN